MSVRKTIRLQDNEDMHLQAYVRQVGSKENYVIRLALRRFLGLPHTDPDDETDVTRNQERK